MLATTRREKLFAEGFEFYAFPTAEAREEYKATFTAAEFRETEEVCMEEYTIFFLGVRELHGKAAAHAAMIYGNE